MTSSSEFDLDSSVSIIIATRERPATLRPCLARVFAQDYSPLEVIVIDNSPDDQSQQVVGEFPMAEYLKCDFRSDNVASLRNLAIGHASGQLLAFIDDDTFVEPGWLAALAGTFSDPSIGGVTGRTITPDVAEDNSPIIGRLSPRGEFIGAGFNNLWSQIVDVDHLQGCNMAVRRSLVKSLGGFDPLMHYSREDVELGLRIKSFGYRLVFQPKAIVHHVLAPRSASTIRRADHDRRSRFVHSRSLAYLFVKYYGLRFDFAKTAFWQLPRYDAGRLLRSPSIDALGMLLATYVGVLVGYCWACLARIGLHRVPDPYARQQVVEVNPNRIRDR